MTEHRDPWYPGGQRNAAIWVEEFFRIYPNGKADADTMLGWFANAIETGVMLALAPATSDEGDMIWTWTKGCCDGALTHASGCPAASDGSLDVGDLEAFERDSDFAALVMRAIAETPRSTGFVLRGNRDWVTVAYEWSGTGPDASTSRIGPKDNETLAALHDALAARLSESPSEGKTE